jgi:hypothetical protein
LVQQLTGEFTWCDLIARSGGSIENLDPHTTPSDPVAEFGREVPLHLFAAELSNAGQEGRDSDFRAFFWEKAMALGDRITWIAFTHAHFPCAAIRGGRGQYQFIAQSPEAEEPDAKLPLNPRALARGKPAFDRIADVCGDILEIRQSFSCAGYPAPIIGNPQKVLSVLSAAGDCNVDGASVDGVFNQFGNSLKWILL